MYADKITVSMQQTIDETARRRAKQMAYNQKNNIVPQALNKTKEGIYRQSAVAGIRNNVYVEKEEIDIAADPVVQYMSSEALSKAIAAARKNMENAAKELDFITAARFRDELFQLEKIYNSKS